MSDSPLAGTKVLVVGGAGFVGSNLVRALLEHEPREILVVDNLLSSERDNVPDDPRVALVEGSITDEQVIGDLPGDLDYAFHLATYHGNQSSMADPLADHEHNTYSTLRLYEGIKDFTGLKRVVYASAGCTVAEKTFDGRGGDHGGCTGLPVARQSLPDLEDHRRVLLELLLHTSFTPGREGAIPERVRPRRDPRCRTLAGHGEHGVAKRRAHVHLQGDARGGAAGRERRRRDPRLHLRWRHGAGLIGCAVRGEAGEVYNLASGRETSILELAELVNELTGNETPLALTPARDWDHSGQRYGSTEKAHDALGFPPT